MSRRYLLAAAAFASMSAGCGAPAELDVDVAREAVVYGDDGRIEVHQETNTALQNAARTAAVSIIERKNVSVEGGVVRLADASAGEQLALREGQRVARSGGRSVPFDARLRSARLDLSWAEMAELRIDVWSDIACPWCYVGKRRFESALKEFPHAGDVEVLWHAFELDPGAPMERDPSISHAERIARKYGITVAQAERSTERLVEAGLGEGIAFDFQHIRSGNTFDAHRLVRLGLERGVQGRVKERLLRAYFEEGQLMSEHGTLLRLGVEAGLEERETADLLASDTYASDVRVDETAAHELGIDGVPCFVLDGRFGVSGAQSPQVLLSALHHAWTERRESDAPPPEGAVCGPDGC